MKIWDIFDQDLYWEMLNTHCIRLQTHPTLPLTVAVYTEHTQFDKIWNPVTRACRGLIFDNDYNLISRPFPKFGNYGENQADKFLINHPVEVTDKMDGSLGIYWQYDGQHGIATKGSFASDQAICATKMWNEKYGFPISTDWTYLFEIIYPSNRIVLNYGDMDELVLLGVMDNAEGSVIPAERVYTWRGPKTTSFPYKTLREALEAPQRPNAEGFVIYFPDLDYRIKLKQDDYVELHKLMTGWTSRRVWKVLKDGGDLAYMVELVPDEWFEWLMATHDKLMRQFLLQKLAILMELRMIMLQLCPGYTKRQFAELALQSENFGPLLAIIDGYSADYRDKKIWDIVYPPAD